MQCPECEYICFKQTKVCGGCGFNFKEASTSAKDLFRDESFTIFAGSKTSAKEQESSTIETQTGDPDIAVMEPPEAIQESPELESGEFLLNLSGAEEQASSLESSNSESETMEYSPMEFGSDADINLEEIEVEGLGLGLEPLEDEPSEPENLKSEERILEIVNESEMLDLAPEEEEGTLEIIDEPKVLDLGSGDSDSPVEITLDEEPEIEPVSLSEEESLAFEIDTTVPLDEELAHEPIQSMVQEEAPSETDPLILDLGEDETSLEIDEGSELGSPEKSPPASTPTDELDLKLEIDDSDGPLTTLNVETPEIEIEDLGLELEDSDTPPAPDPKKP